MNRKNRKTGNNPVTLLLFIVLSLVLTFPVIAKETASRTFHDEIMAKDIEKVALETIDGSIEVSGWDGDQVIIDAEIKVVGKDLDVCRELLENVKIEVEEKGKFLDIEPEFRSKRKYSVSVSFEVQLPSRMAVDVETVNGSVKVTGVHGGAEIESINGHIGCRSIKGNIEAATVNGGIDLEDILGNVEAATVNGGISLECGSESPDVIELGTVNGGIEASFDGEVNAMIDVSAMNGSIKLEGFPSVELNRKARKFSTTLGNGNGSYEFSTINGSVTVAVKTAE